MSFDRENWSGIFRKEDVPKFKCPKCDQGHLIGDDSAFIVKEPAYSTAEGKSQDWEPGWTTERFTGFLTCDRSSCGEIVAVAGDTTVVENYDEEFGWGLLTVMRPHAFFPPPPIIDRPKELPSSIENELRQSFQLFWSDLNACASRLRISVERLLDHFKVPLDTVKKGSNKTVRLDLNGRISIFAQQDPDAAKTLTALRMIGNLGAHGDSVSREAVLDAYEVYEDCLSEVFGKRTARLAAMRQKLIQAKGKY